MTGENKPLTAGRIVDELRKCGITHIVWLPDTGSQIVAEAVNGQADFTLVPVCREGEAIAIAVGLMLAKSVLPASPLRPGMPVCTSLPIWRGWRGT